MNKLIIVVFSVFLLSCSSSVQPNINKGNQQSSKPSIDILAHKDLENYFRAHPELRSIPTPEEWEKLRWLSKAMIIFRGGQGLTPEEDIQFYLKKEKSEIVDLLMQDERFFETILKFNYFLFGVDLDKVFDEEFSLKSTEIHPALLSAKPYDFSNQTVLETKTAVYNRDEYISVHNLTNTLYEIFGVQKENYWKKALNSPVAPLISALIR